MTKFYKIRPKVRPLTLVLLIFCLAIYLTYPPTVSAHAYSASYTKITMDKKQTKVVFSLDTLSVLELAPKIDANKNFIIDKSEIKKEEHRIEELITEGLTLDNGNKEQTPTVEKIEIVKKETKEFLSVTMTFPAFSPGDTLIFNDGFYFHDTGTNYVNLISSSYMGETSEAVLQGKERTWTMLVTEPQYEQGQEPPGEQGAGTDQGQGGGADQGQGGGADQEQGAGAGKEQQNAAAKPVEKSGTSSWFSFFKLGTLHILTGYDHLLFLFALLLRKQTFKQYAAIVTSFTIAHSITLSLAVLGLFTLPSRFVEATIAFSICYVALENIFRKEIRHRWSITFLFGLIHGLGFASILREMAIPKSHLAVALINFNLGIESVQLLIVLLLLPLLTMMFKLKNSRKIVTYGSYVIVALGAIWLVERVFF